MCSFQGSSWKQKHYSSSDRGFPCGKYRESGRYWSSNEAQSPEVEYSLHLSAKPPLTVPWTQTPRINSYLYPSCLRTMGLDILKNADPLVPIELFYCLVSLTYFPTNVVAEPSPFNDACLYKLRHVAIISSKIKLEQQWSWKGLHKAFQLHPCPTRSETFFSYRETSVLSSKSPTMPGLSSTCQSGHHLDCAC